MVVLLSLCCLRPVLGDIRVTASRNGNTEWTNLTAAPKSNSSWMTKRKGLHPFKPKILLRLSRWNCFLCIKIILSLLRIPLKSWKDVSIKIISPSLPWSIISFKGFGFQELCWWNNLHLDSTSHLEGSRITLQNLKCVKELPPLTTKVKTCSHL